MNFSQALSDLLVANGGSVSFEQVTELLPAVSRHKVMAYLNGARNEGVCNYTVKNQGGKMVISITTAQPVNVPSGGDA